MPTKERANDMKWLKRSFSVLIPSLIAVFLCIFYMDQTTLPGQPPIVNEVKEIPVTLQAPKSITPVEITYPTPPAWVPYEYIHYLMAQCDDPNYTTQVPYLLIFKLIDWESGWLQSRRTPNYDQFGNILSYDVGRMALNSLGIKDLIHRFHDLNRKESSYDVYNNPYDNAQIGIRYLRSLYDELGSWTMAITAYNEGHSKAVRGILLPPTVREVNYVVPVEGWWTFPSNVRVVRKTK